MKKFTYSILIAAAMCLGSAQAEEVVVKIAPPHAVVEHRVVAPSPRHVWIAGYHRWDGHAYVWVPGRWELPPREHSGMGCSSLGTPERGLCVCRRPLEIAG